MVKQTKNVIGYEDRYWVTNAGEIISLPNGSRLIAGNLKQERIKRKHTTYRRVTLCVGNTTKRYLVHQLVALHFIPNPENKPCINHIDNNGENNHTDNLEWCTHKENMLHSEKQGRQIKSHKLGGKATALITEKRVLKELTLLLGKRLITTEIRKRSNTSSRFVTYQCKYCNNQYTRRSDAPAISRGGVCTDCFRDEDMVWTA